MRPVARLGVRRGVRLVAGLGVGPEARPVADLEARLGVGLGARPVADLEAACPALSLEARRAAVLAACS